MRGSAHEDLPEFTSFDSVETYVIKLCTHWQVPPAWIIIFDALTFLPRFLNAREFVSTRILPGDGSAGKSLELIDRELVKLVRRNVSDIVFQVALACLMEPLSKVTDIERIGADYPAAYADDVEAYIAMLNAYSITLRHNAGKPMTFRDVKTKYLEGRAARTIQMATVASLLERINRVQDAYTMAIEGTKLRISELVIISEKLHFVITDEISEQDTYPLFELLKPTPEIRHIVCMGARAPYQKVYIPGPFEKLTERKGAIIEPGVLPAHTIAFTVCAELGVYRFTLHVGEGYIEGQVKKADAEAVSRMISAFFPHPLAASTSEYTAQLRFYPIEARSFDICVHYLMHRTMSDAFPFYVNESTYPLADKPKPNFRFRQPWGRSVLLPGYRPSPGKKDEAIFTITAPKLSDGHNYIAVDVLKVFSLPSLYRAMTYIVPAVVLYYTLDLAGVSPLARVYNLPLPPRLALEQEQSVRGMKKVAAQLNDEWPTVFTKAYLASVSSLRNLVVTTTNPLDAEQWTTQIISKTKEQHQRTVGVFRFEDGRPMFYYTSISADAPFVGLAPNLADENPLYPYVPASFVSESGYRDVSGSGIGETKSLMALTEGTQEGIAPEPLDVLIGKSVIRRAVPKGPLALLHAVVIALEKEDVPGYATSLLQAVRALSPELLRQQFYEPKADLASEGDYLDPALYVPALEYLTGMDIYVISPTTRDNVITHTFDLPRHKEFYCRGAETTECILIYHNPGKKSDKLVHKHCELLIGAKTKNRIFSQDVSARMLRAMCDTNRFVHATAGKAYPNSQCMISRIQTLLQDMSVVSQIIDAYGHMRAVTVQTTDDGLCTLFCFPSAPLEVREDQTVHMSTWKWFSLFFTPLGRSGIGAWGRHEATQEVVYARLTDLPLDLTVIGQDPLVIGDKTESNYIPVCIAKDKLALVLRETAKWLFEVWCTETGLRDPEMFLRENFGWKQTPSHTSTGLGMIGRSAAPEEAHYLPTASDVRVFPSVGSFSQARAFAEANVFPVDAEKIFVLHSREYAESLLYVLRQHSRMMLLSQATTERRYVPGTYASLRDFAQLPNTRILAGLGLTGQMELAAGGDIPTVITELHEDMLTSQDPLLYRAPNGVYYLIQATQAATISSAYLLCAMWEKGQRNLGYTLQAIDAEYLSFPTNEEMEVPCIVYAVDMNILSPALCLVKGETTSLPPPDDRAEFYELVVHGNRKYCALMRLR